MRHHKDVAELAKVIVKRDSGRNAEIVDDDFGGAVGEAPASGGALLEEDPGAADLLLFNEFDFHLIGMEEHSADFNGFCWTPASNEQGQCLVHTIVGC